LPRRRSAFPCCRNKIIVYIISLTPSFEEIIALLRVVTEGPIQPLVKEESPFQNTKMNGLGKNKNMVTGPETKSGCAGEGQQQFTTLVCSAQASKG
jgi:hypothetical protein